MNVKVKAIHSPKSLDKVVSEVAEKTVNKISDDTFSEIGENVKKNVNLNKLIERQKMFLIVNENNQVFSRYTPNNGLYVEQWADKIDLDNMIPIQISIYPHEGIAQSTINNILSYRSGNSLPNKNETLKIVPFNEYFKG